MSTFKFLHCSDLHIDSPSKGLSSVCPSPAERFRNSTHLSFQNVIKLALKDDVFVNFDDDRNDQMIGLVQHFAKSRQVVVLTCHRRIFEEYSSKGANPVTVG